MRRTMRLAAAASAVTLAMAGCGPGLFSAGQTASSGRPVVLTQNVTASALVAVTGADGPDSLLFHVLAATARPQEHLDIEQAGGGGQAPVVSAAPAPATVRIAGRPDPPAGGATSFQEASYDKQVRIWEGQEAAGQHTVAVRTSQATATWVRALLARAAGPARADADASAATLGSESALAASVLSGLVDQAGIRFSGRVLVLAVSSLDGTPPAGELDGDDVFVLMSTVPGAAAAAAAQQDLIATGASQAAVLGPEATPAELAQVVAEGLGARQVTDAMSGPALFANDSAVLQPSAAVVLAPLIARLEEPGVTAVINGYASATGSVAHNLRLSQDRAVAVTRYLEAHGVSAAELFAVGHGATNLVGSGSSGDNRRVVVVIDQPAGGA